MTTEKLKLVQNIEAMRKKAGIKTKSINADQKKPRENLTSPTSSPKFSHLAAENQIAIKQPEPIHQLPPISKPKNVSKRHWINRNYIDKGNSSWKKVYDHIISYRGSGYMFVLLGNRGTGKTQLAVNLIAYALIYGVTADYCKARYISALVRESYSRKNNDPFLTELSAIRRFTSPRLLVVDEVGERTCTASDDQFLIDIIDSRYGNMKDTIMIANQKPDEFYASIGASISSRILETGSVIVCDWESFRSPKNERK